MSDLSKLEFLSSVYFPSPTQSYWGRQARRKHVWMSASGMLLRVRLRFYVCVLDSNRVTRCSVVSGGGCVCICFFILEECLNIYQSEIFVLDSIAVIASREFTPPPVLLRSTLARTHTQVECWADYSAVISEASYYCTVLR